MRKIFEVLRLSVADGRSHREIARVTCLISSDHSFLENGLRFGG